MFMAQETIFVFLSLADVVCVRTLGDNATIAVTFATTIYALMFNLQLVFTTSLRVIQARYYGANDLKGVASALTSATIISEGIAITVSIAYLIGGKSLLSLFALTPEQLEIAHSYLLARLSGYCIYALVNGIPRTIEASGQIGKLTKVRLCNLINVPLNLVFIPILGAAGAAVATNITEFTELILMMIIFKPKFGRPEKHKFKEVLRYGLVQLPMRFVSPFTNTLISNAYLQYLTPIHLVVLNVVDSLYYQLQCIMASPAMWIETEMGQAYGSGDMSLFQSKCTQFKHCYARLIVCHIPVTIIFGYVYLSFIAPVGDIWLAMELLISRIAIALPFYIANASQRMLTILGVLRPPMIARMVGLIITKMAAAYIALSLGADVFTLPICYFAGDIPFIITVLWCLKKKQNVLRVCIEN